MISGASRARIYLGFDRAMAASPLIAPRRPFELDRVMSTDFMRKLEWKAGIDGLMFLQANLERQSGIFSEIYSVSPGMDLGDIQRLIVSAM
jgi:hypothetical protein